MFCAALLVSTSGFTPSPALRLPAAAGTCRSGAACSMSTAEEPNVMRRSVVAGFVGSLVGYVGATPAMAGYVTSLGFETTKPEDAEKDMDVLATDAVQKGLTELKAYKVAASELKAEFAKDNNMALIPPIRKTFDFAKLRDSLNIVGTVLDDTTQLTTDRLERAILYDLTELENAARFKKGEDTRTPKKVANVDKWFDKLDGDLSTLLKYFS